MKKILHLLPEQADICNVLQEPLPGPTWICGVCFTRVRTGQPHRALDPKPHATLQACIVHEEIT